VATVSLPPSLRSRHSAECQCGETGWTEGVRRLAEPASGVVGIVNLPQNPVHRIVGRAVNKLLAGPGPGDGIDRDHDRPFEPLRAMDGDHLDSVTIGASTLPYESASPSSQAREISRTKRLSPLTP
jgi:hypothetical protein